MKTSPTINRTIVLIKGKKPFYDWSNAVFPNAQPLDLASVKDYNSYLIEDEAFNGDPKISLEAHWEDIFKNELFGICTNPEKWPTLSWSLFTKWFTLQFSSMVHDLVEDDLYSEHYE